MSVCVITFFKRFFIFPGPSLFFSCPMDYKAAEGWFVNVWNYNVIPYLHQALRSGRKVKKMLLVFPLYLNVQFFSVDFKQQHLERVVQEENESQKSKVDIC